MYCQALCPNCHAKKTRKKVDCKDVINELQKILDEKNLPWSYRLGKVLGAKKPEGHLESFLGEEIISSLCR